MSKRPTKNKSENNNKKRLCAEPNCKSGPASKGFCRLHYIANWRHLKLNARIKAEQKLNAYVDRLAKKYPADYLEKIKEGLEDEEKFRQTVEELDVDAEVGAPETENEFLEKFLRDIKGGGGTGGSGFGGE